MLTTSGNKLIPFLLCAGEAVALAGVLLGWDWGSLSPWPPKSIWLRLFRSKLEIFQLLASCAGEGAFKMQILWWVFLHQNFNYLQYEGNTFRQFLFFIITWQQVQTPLLYPQFLTYTHRHTVARISWQTIINN